MLNLVYVAIHTIVCLVLIGLVLLQQGKGASTAFGTGASSTVFGSKGSNSFTVKATALLALIFFFSTINLNYTNIKEKKNSEIIKVLTSSKNVKKVSK